MDELDEAEEKERKEAEAKEPAPSTTNPSTHGVNSPNLFSSLSPSFWETWGGDVGIPLATPSSWGSSLVPTCSPYAHIPSIWLGIALVSLLTSSLGFL